jgi:hypothetical protein
MTAGFNTKPAVGLLRHGERRRAREADEVPIGSIVRTPTGRDARVIGYRGFRRDFMVRLVCRYLEPENKRFDVVLLAPELVVVMVKGGK